MGLIALTDLLEEADGDAMGISALSQLPRGRCSCIIHIARLSSLDLMHRYMTTHFALLALFLQTTKDTSEIEIVN